MRRVRDPPWLTENRYETKGLLEVDVELGSSKFPVCKEWVCDWTLEPGVPNQETCEVRH